MCSRRQGVTDNYGYLFFSLYAHILNICTYKHVYVHTYVCASAVMLHACSCLQALQPTLSNVKYTAVCEYCD